MRNATATKPRGRHPQHRLTPITLRTARAPGRYADGQGLYLVVDPSGAKRWIWRGIIQGKRCDLGLGSTALVPLAEARRAALDCRRTARTGGDPRLARQQAQRPVPTVRAAALQVHAGLSATFRNPKHKAQWLATLDADVFPTLGAQPVSTVTSGDVLKVLSKIWTVKPETARRVKQRLTLIFDWAKASGYRDGDNPTDGLAQVLPKHRDSVQHHAALPFGAVPGFVAALRTAADTGETIRLALELLILTATRTTEVQLATWPEVDLDARLWTIPGARMKMGRDHRIPLCPRAVEIFQRARQLSADSPWIFPGKDPAKPLSKNAFQKASRRLTAVPLTPHGFRSSFRDWSAERTNVPHAVCEAALAHAVKDKTEAAYHRTDLFEKRRELLDLWARFVTTTPATVVVLHA